jgi:hypothetical protein
MWALKHIDWETARLVTSAIANWLQSACGRHTQTIWAQANFSSVSQNLSRHLFRRRRPTRLASTRARALTHILNQSKSTRVDNRGSSQHTFAFAYTHAKLITTQLIGMGSAGNCVSPSRWRPVVVPGRRNRGAPQGSARPVHSRRTPSTFFAALLVGRWSAASRLLSRYSRFGLAAARARK